MIYFFKIKKCIFQENVPDAPILKMISDEEGTSTASETEKVEMEIEKQQEKGKEESIKENVKNVLQLYKEINERVPETVAAEQKIDFFFRELCFFF